MTIKTRQFALAANTATNLLPSAVFKYLPAAFDNLPVVIKNEDPSAIMWTGGPDVSNTQGQSLGPGESKTYALYGNDVPWAYTQSASGPIISVEVGRQ